MASIVSKGYYPNSAAGHIDKDWELFSQNINLLLRHQQTILACSDYFFCSPSFSWVSWPWTSNDGPLVIGYLLLGYNNRLLIQPCPDSGCGGEVLITSFFGSVLSGDNSYSGYCTNCRSRKTGSRTDIPVYDLVNFISKLRQTFPAVVKEIETYSGHQFCWGGTGLERVKKQRIISKPVCKPVTLTVLIEELKSNNIRAATPINVYLLKKDIQLKLSKSLQKDSVHMKL